MVDPTRLRMSRKGKKAWRKNVDVSAVQNGLLNAQSQIEAIGGVIADQPNNKLFAIETTPNKQQASKHVDTILRADSIALARSAVPPVRSRKRTTIDRCKGRNMKEFTKNIFENAALPVMSREKLSDIWNIDMSEYGSCRYDQVNEKERLYKPVTLQNQTSESTTYAIQHVKLPLSAQSYNPEYSVWESFIRNTAEKELSKIEREKKMRINFVDVANRISTNSEILTRATSVSNEDSMSEYEDVRVEVKSKGSARKIFFKHRKSRQKRAKRLAQQKLAYQQHIKRQFEFDIANISKFAKEVDDRKNFGTEKPLTSKRHQQLRRKIRKHGLPSAPLELQTSDELTNSLRRLKTEGSLMKDRFRSIQERGLMEVRFPIRKQFKKKLVEKHTYRHWFR